ncbi:MAG: hypothetical protein D6739_02620 [Nitrospirae bacterium]|nr:MAG: hypothetical protein D6739_02620 [Nitrospirota bacterium]
MSGPCRLRPWLALLLVAVAACSPVARHRVLTFFFDGVPPLGGEAPKRQGPLKYARRQDTVASLAKELGIEPDFVGPVAPRFKRHLVYRHPPFAEKRCGACHRLAKGSSRMPTGVEFVLPKRILCGKCHKDKRREALAARYKWLHAPTQYGACLKCHNPHESTHPYMAQKGPVQALCYQCHDHDRLVRTEAHATIGTRDCTDCHDPHGSDRQYMLLPEVEGGAEEAGGAG